MKPPFPAQFSAALLLIELCCLGVVGAPAQAEEPNKFQPQPKDPTMQPIPPKPTGRIQIKGNQSFKEEQLRVPLADQIREINEKGLTRARGDDAAYYLAAFYRKQGYSQAEVEFAIDGSVLILTIKEGVRTYLRRVAFAGNHADDAKTLYQYMIGATEEQVLKEPTRFPFVETDIQTGVARIRGLYESEGRLDATVKDAVITYSTDHTRADVAVEINEGARYTVGNITFGGPAVYDRATLLKALGEPLDSAYTTQRVNAMQHNLEYYYKLHGYYAAQVSASGNPKAAAPARDHRLVPVSFTLAPGPLYRFDSATVTGLKRLHPSVVKNRFRKLKGQVYSPTAMDESFRELLRTGLFRNLTINTVPLPSDEVQINLSAEEAKPKELGLSVGYSTYEGIILGIRLGDRDLFGSGRPLTLDLEHSQRTERADLTYTNPWLFESDYKFTSRAFVQQRDEEGYSKQDTGLRLEITRKLNPHVEFSVFAQGKDVNITQYSIVEQYIGPTAYQIATVGITQSLDYRDSPVSPSKGWILGSGADFDTIGGQAAFARGTLRFSYYIPIHQNFLLALGARGGLIVPFTEVPIDERYFNGGATTVRSFLERYLGPLDPHHYPIGGEAFTVFNAELQFPLHDALHGAIFFDAGNVIADYKQASLNDMRYGIGAGLRYNLPIGPIRLDVGVNPDPQKYEKWGAVQFSFGFAF
jgi:outer membrane protein assembly complex protein YaeT